MTAQGREPGAALAPHGAECVCVRCPTSRPTSRGDGAMLSAREMREEPRV